MEYLLFIRVWRGRCDYGDCERLSRARVGASEPFPLNSTRMTVYTANTTGYEVHNISHTLQTHKKHSRAAQPSDSISRFRAERFH